MTIHWASRAAHAEPEMGLRVRSKRRGEDEHGVIVYHRHESISVYQWLVRWDDGTEEWCRGGELRAARVESGMLTTTALVVGVVSTIVSAFVLADARHRRRRPPEPPRDKYGCLPNEFPTLDQIWSSAQCRREKREAEEAERRARAGMGGYRS